MKTPCTWVVFALLAPGIGVLSHAAQVTANANPDPQVFPPHGHQGGVRPPASMTVPPDLPLEAGLITCATCHPDATADEGEATYTSLRMENGRAQLCLACHKGMEKGPSHHPTGPLPWPVPRVLLEAGAKAGAAPGEVTCLTCHTAHGAAQNDSLVMDASTNDLCMTCHDRLDVAKYRDTHAYKHPMNVRLEPEQLQLVAALDTRAGPDGQLLCVTCHRLHDGSEQPFLLAERLHEARLCLGCHADKRALFDSPHDIRPTPTPPAAGGAASCGACHLIHSRARPAEPASIGPGSAACVGCHKPGGIAEASVLGDVNHPGVSCTNCHDPHTVEHGRFLRRPARQLCTSCHQQRAAMAGGPHDSATDSEAWRLRQNGTSGLCVDCHRAHGDRSAGLFRAGLAKGLAEPDGACVACHPGQAWGHAHTGAVHPQAAGPVVVRALLPLVGSGGTDEPPARVGCRTCHDAHAAPASPALLRVKPGEPTEELCLGCHDQVRQIAQTPHASDRLANAGIESVACQPCHAMHADDIVQGRGAAQSVAGTSSSMLSGGADPACRDCHRVGGAAVVPSAVAHPSRAMFNSAPAGTGVSLPLFDRTGQVSATGSVWCQTCHVPHGRPIPEASTLLADFWRPLVRSFQPPNLCTTCHGFDGLRRFLYYHDAERRGGPLSDPGGARVVLPRPR